MDLLGGYGSDDSESSVDADAPKPTAVTTTTAATISAGAAKPPAKTSRRGKRIVSLHAVLPTHILNQLEKSTATGGLDSDDDDEQDELVSRATTASTSRPDAKQHAVVGKDEGLSSFLTELKSAPTTAVVGGVNSSAGDDKPAPSQPLGHAFTTKTVVVSTVSDEVVDVHASAKAVSQDTKVKASHVVMPTATRPSASVSVPRPSAKRPAPAAGPLAPQPQAKVPIQQQQVQQQQAPYYHPDIVDAQDEPKMDDHRAKKRSRRELEKALRSGNLDALEKSERVTTLDATGSVYVPQEETYAVPASGAVKVAPVRMYDPKAGSDVVQANVTGKQRGKHQINQLLASAANLELQRARSVGTGVKNKRVDAKRKYGW